MEEVVGGVEASWRVWSASETTPGRRRDDDVFGGERGEVGSRGSKQVDISTPCESESMGLRDDTLELRRVGAYGIGILVNKDE
ncbi:hypothetical protein E2562_009736 [Oryza meyeriana var. granulata]|uniref:Uncharacterized protein n=1 Tax=Oryza meyeriana var. granulata TaxID=110450 RepID=A0A6G1D1W1_9ORYZ|nr:hypothetical protein E2562_009736 [Oryza meyeriana var. granulata]